MTGSRQPRPPSLTLPLLLILAACSGFPPFAIDTYLPGFPQIADELDASAAQVQLTLTTFLLATAVGQVVWGSLSDQLGRRPVLLGGIAVGMVASLACALTESIWLLLAMRALQGLGTGAVMVVARAVVADVSTGASAARTFSTLSAVQSIAPVAAPVMGGLLIGPLGWRAAFWMLFAMTVCMSVAIARLIPETLPAGARSGGGLRGIGSDARFVLADRGYLGAMLALAAGFGTMFAYISASPFVVQNLLGFSELEYSASFTVTSLAMVAMIMVNRRLLLTTTATRLMPLGAAGQGIGVLTLLLTIFVLDYETIGMLIGFLLVQASAALLISNCNATAVMRARPRAGTGSALMGGAQFATAAVVAPLVGMAGEHSAVPMVLVMSVSVLLCAAGVALVHTAPPPRRPAAT